MTARDHVSDTWSTDTFPGQLSIRSLWCAAFGLTLALQSLSALAADPSDILNVEAGSSQPRPVTTAALADIAFYPQRDAPATAISLNDTRVSAEISGVLSSIRVRVGDSIRQGDVLATIDCRDYAIAVTEAEAALRAAEAKSRFDRSQLETARKLSSSKSISAEELERRMANSAGSAAELDRLRAVLARASNAEEKCDIKAPFDAVVVERLSNLGDYQVQGKPVLRLLDRENIEISAMVQEQDLESLKSAREPRFVTNGKEYPLVLRAVLPLMDSRVRSYEVRLSFADHKASPGSVGRRPWNLSQVHVPADLLVRRAGLGIFLTREDHAYFHALPLASEGQPAVIDTPMSAHVIVDGRFGLNDGDVIRVLEP